MKSWEPGSFPFGQTGFRHHHCPGTLQWKVTNFLNITDTAPAHLTQPVNSIQHRWPRPPPCGRTLLVPPPFLSLHWVTCFYLFALCKQVSASTQGLSGPLSFPAFSLFHLVTSFLWLLISPLSMSNSVFRTSFVLPHPTVSLTFLLKYLTIISTSIWSRKQVSFSLQTWPFLDLSYLVQWRYHLWSCSKTINLEVVPKSSLFLMAHIQSVI